MNAAGEETSERYQWYDYIEFFLIADCIVLVAYNVVILFYRRIYTSWSTSTILIFFSCLLLARMGCLMLYATRRIDTHLIGALALSSVVSDIPCFFLQMVCLAIIWQWNRIANLLLKPQLAMNQTY